MRQGGGRSASSHGGSEEQAGQRERGKGAATAVQVEEGASCRIEDSRIGTRTAEHLLPHMLLHPPSCISTPCCSCSNHPLLPGPCMPPVRIPHLQPFPHGFKRIEGWVRNNTELTASSFFHYHTLLRSFCQTPPLINCSAAYVPSPAPSPKYATTSTAA